MTKKRTPVSNGKPAVVATCNQSTHRLWILRDGDSVSMNSSSKYDHRSNGPGLFKESTGPDGTRWIEGYSDDPDLWTWINRMVNLGMRFIETNEDATVRRECDLIAQRIANEPERNADR